MADRCTQHTYKAQDNFARSHCNHRQYAAGKDPTKCKIHQPDRIEARQTAKAAKFDREARVREAKDRVQRAEYDLVKTVMDILEASRQAPYADAEPVWKAAERVAKARRALPWNKE